MDGPDRAAVVRRLVALEGEGRLGSEQVRLAADALKVSGRSVWRWVRQALSRRPGSRRWCSSRGALRPSGNVYLPGHPSHQPRHRPQTYIQKASATAGRQAALPPRLAGQQEAPSRRSTWQRARTREGPPRAPALRVVTASTSWPFAAAHYHCSKAGYRVGSDRGSPNQGSTLLSKRVMAQIRSPVRVRT